MLKIVSVALCDRTTGLIFSLEGNKRHSDLFLELAKLEVSKYVMTQGFLTSDGYFVDRVTGIDIARKAGQLRKETTREMLLSEDLW